MAEALIDIAKRGAWSTESTFANPDDDWTPVLLVLDRAAKLHVIALTILSDKDDTASSITECCATLGAVEAAMIVSSWQASAPTTEAQAALLPSQRPDRIEVLVICAAGGRRGKTTSVASIIRHPNQPPTLGPFEDTENAGGRFVEALTHGIAKGSNG